MTINIDTFLDSLQYQLQTALPGKDAHLKMSPRQIRGNRFKFNTKRETKKGSVLILLYYHEDKWHFPLIQRPKYQGAHSGQISLPGGKQEVSDPDSVHTALRETEEEIGINKNQVKVLGHLSRLYIAASNYDVLPVVGYLDQSPLFVPDNHEVEHVVDARLDDLLNEKLHKNTEMQVGPNVIINSPYFHLNDKIVWGATAMMLSEFSEVVRRCMC